MQSMWVPLYEALAKHFPVPTLLLVSLGLRKERGPLRLQWLSGHVLGLPLKSVARAPKVSSTDCLWEVVWIFLL